MHRQDGISRLIVLMVVAALAVGGTAAPASAQSTLYDDFSGGDLASPAYAEIDVLIDNVRVNP